MIEYKICDKLIDLLDKEDLNGLRKYIDSERNKYYLSIARKALDKYLVRHDHAYYDCDDFSFGKLVLLDYYSVYFLESDEILTPQRKKLGSRVHNTSYRALSLYDKLAINQEAVEEILKDDLGMRDNKTLIDLKTKEGKIYTFYEDEFSFAEKFLGEDVEYSVSNTDIFNEGPVCLVKSKKGTGFILGRKEI